MQRKVCSTDLEQQNGRGIRQGNNFDEVGIYHYLTEETFDAYLMGIITNKAKFISQIMTSKEPARISEDIDETVLTYSQMQAIASGNPLIQEKIQLDNDIAVLKTLEAEHKKSAYKMQELAEKTLPKAIENYAVLLEKASSDLKKYQDAVIMTARTHDNAEFSIEIGGKVYDERADAGKEIEKAIIKCSTIGESVSLGKYFGFDVTVEKPSTFTLSNPCVIVLHGSLRYTTEVALKNEVGNVRRLEHLAGSSINQKIQQLSTDLEKAKSDLAEARANMTKPFERAAELEEKQKRLTVVNAELSCTNIDSTDEPVPVSDTPEDDEPVQSASVVIAVPAVANADKVNMKPPVPQTDVPKPAYKKIGGR